MAKNPKINQHKNKLISVTRDETQFAFEIAFLIIPSENVSVVLCQLQLLSLLSVNVVMVIIKLDQSKLSG